MKAIITALQAGNILELGLVPGKLSDRVKEIRQELEPIPGALQLQMWFPTLELAMQTDCQQGVNTPATKRSAL